MKILGKLASKVVAINSLRWWLPALLGIAILFFPFPAGLRQPAVRSFRIEASRFAYTPAILKVNRGDRVTIDLVSTDVVHGLSIDGYDVQMITDPGQTARLTFIANRSGSFRFRCTATCGPLHPFMIGKIRVGDNTLWWRAAGLSLLAVGSVLWRRLV